MRYTRTVGDKVETFEADTLEGVKELMTLSEWVPEVGGSGWWSIIQSKGCDEDLGPGPLPPEAEALKGKPHRDTQVSPEGFVGHTINHDMGPKGVKLRQTLKCACGYEGPDLGGVIDSIESWACPACGKMHTT